MYNSLGLLKKTIQDFSSETTEYINNSYSPWAFADQITHLAEQGKAKKIESCKIWDLSQFIYQPTWSGYLSSIKNIRRKIHVINDLNLIHEGLKQGRSSKRYSIYYTVADAEIGSSDNMLICPSNEHTRLRSPFENTLSKRGITEKYLLELAKRIAIDGISHGISDLSLLKTDLCQIANNHSNFSQKEAISSLDTLEKTSLHTTDESLKFITALLAENPKWANQMHEEFIQRFEVLSDTCFCTSSNFFDQIKEEFAKELILFVEGGEWKNRWYTKKIEPSATLHSFVLEALRLYPVMPQIVRVANEHFDLGDQKIQPGDVVMFNVLGYQRDANLWPEPEKFKPERFFGNGSKPNLLKDKSLLNFSSGPYHCIGENLAKYTLLLSTARLALKIALENKMKPKSPNSPLTYKVIPPIMIANVK